MSQRVELKTKKPLRILCVGDTHFPYGKVSAVNKVIQFAKEFKPTHVVQIGDLYDQYNFSSFPKSEDNAELEMFMGRTEAENFWAQMPKGAEKFQLIGNHCMRMLKKIKRVAPEMESIVKKYWVEAYKFDGVRTLSDDRSELVINDILFIHGYLSNLGDHLKFNRQSTVVGHSHRGGVNFLRHKDQTLFELNCGHLADDQTLPFSYTAQRTTFWTNGVGTIEELSNGSIVPTFIPL